MNHKLLTLFLLSKYFRLRIASGLPPPHLLNPSSPLCTFTSISVLNNDPPLLLATHLTSTNLSSNRTQALLIVQPGKDLVGTCRSNVAFGD